MGREDILYSMRLLCILVLVFHAIVAHADTDLDETLFRDRKHGVRINIPEGWTPSVQTGYPSLLLLMAPIRGEGQLSLAVGLRPSGKSLRDIVSYNNEGIVRLGLRIKSVRPATIFGRQVLEVAASSRGKIEIRQIYLAEAQRVFILTLSCPSDEVVQLSIELHNILQSLELTQPS
jgi:hypothetical protein